MAQSWQQSITLTRREAATCIRLLGLLQGELESAIESALVPGADIFTAEVLEADIDHQHIVRDRRHWKQAEALVKALDERRRRKVPRT